MSSFSKEIQIVFVIKPSIVMPVIKISSKERIQTRTDRYLSIQKKNNNKDENICNCFCVTPGTFVLINFTVNLFAILF